MNWGILIMEKLQGLENIDKVNEFIKLTRSALRDEEKYKDEIMNVWGNSP